MQFLVFVLFCFLVKDEFRAITAFTVEMKKYDAGEHSVMRQRLDFSDTRISSKHTLHYFQSTTFFIISLFPWL